MSGQIGNSEVLNYVGRRGKPSTWLPRQKLPEESIRVSERNIYRYIPNRNDMFRRVSRNRFSGKN